MAAELTSLGNPNPNTNTEEERGVKGALCA